MASGFDYSTWVQELNAFCTEIRDKNGKLPADILAFLASVASCTHVASKSKPKAKKQPREMQPPQDLPAHEGGTTDNLHPMQRDFLHLHHRMGHTGFEV